MRTGFEVEHIDEAPQPLAGGNSEHLGDLILACHLALAHVLQARVVW